MTSFGAKKQGQRSRHLADQLHAWLASCPRLVRESWRSRSRRVAPPIDVAFAARPPSIQRFDAGHTLDEKSLVLRAPAKFLIEPLTEKRRRDSDTAM